MQKICPFTVYNVPILCDHVPVYNALISNTAHPSFLGSWACTSSAICECYGVIHDAECSMYRKCIYNIVRMTIIPGKVLQNVRTQTSMPPTRQFLGRHMQSPLADTHAELTLSGNSVRFCLQTYTNLISSFKFSRSTNEQLFFFFFLLLLALLLLLLIFLPQGYYDTLSILLYVLKY